MISSLLGKALVTLVEKRGLPSDSTYVLEAEPGKPDIIRRDDGVNMRSVIIKPVHEISNNLVFATSKASDQPAHTRSLIGAFARLSILQLLSY